MSRAFVKDDDDRPERPIARVASDHPNVVTVRGLAQLREFLAAARRDGNERDVAYLERRVADAVVVDLAKQPRDRAAFGATVTVLDANGRATKMRIVGEDEAQPAKGTISWISPLALAVDGKRVGERAIVERPTGPARVEIVKIEYEE